MTMLTIFLAVLVLLLLATVLAPEAMTRYGLGAERWRSGLQLGLAKVEGFDVPYLEGGQGEALLLIHGFAGDKDNFTRIARFLTPHYRVLIPDLPGFGDASRDPGATYGMADQVRRMHAMLLQLGVQRLHIGGNSMGGFIAALFAATHPEMVASVWLLDAAGTEASHETPLLRHYEATGQMPLLVKQEADFANLLKATMARPPYLPGFARKVLARRGMADFDLHTQILRELTDSPLLETQYTHLDTPAFIVWGAQDQILSIDGAAAFHRLFPRGRVHVMDGIGHLPMVEAPAQTARDYLAFRRSLA